MDDKNNIRVSIAFGVLCIAWGTTYMGIKLAIQYIPPFMLSALRHLIAGSIFFAYCILVKKEKIPDGKTLWQLAILACLLIVGGNAFVCWAELEIPSGLTAVICSLSPMLITLFSMVLFKGFYITYKIAIGLLLGLLGVGLIFFKDLDSGSIQEKVFPLLALFFAISCWALGSVLLKKRPLKISIYMSLGTQMLIGGIINLVISWSIEDNHNFWHTPIEGVVGLFYLIIVGSFLGYGSYLYVLQYYAAARVSIHTYMNTIIAVLVGWLIGRESLNEYVIAGTVIALAGVLLVNREYAKLAKLIS